MRTLRMTALGAALAGTLAACSGSTPAVAPTTSSSSSSTSTTDTATPTAPTVATPGAVTPPATPPPPAEGTTPATAPALLTAGSTGDQVRELQHRLRQLGFYTGTIVATFGPQTTAGVIEFQTKRQLPVTGSVDQATWDTLVAATVAPTRDQLYNVAPAGPPIYSAGMSGPKIREMQARLKQIGWYAGDVVDNYGPKTVTAVKGFQAKRNFQVTGAIDQRTLDALISMTHTPTADELNNVTPKPAGTAASGALDPRCLTGRVMCISKRARQLVWVVDGVPQLTLAARFGSDELPTREGVFSVYYKKVDVISNLYHTPMPYSMFFSGGQAVHYSSNFARLGYSGASHGCVNIRDLNGIKWLYDQVRIGDKVVVY